MNETIRNPFIGPRPFSEDEKIYGRNWEIQSLINMLLADRIVLLYSQSGAGKTSLINAGIIRSLKSDTYNFVIPPVIRAGIRSEKLPEGQNRYVWSCLLYLEKYFPEEERMKEAELATYDLNSYITHRWYTDDSENSNSLSNLGKPFLFIFDQFEEVFTDRHDITEKETFIRQLSIAFLPRNRWALFAMREEYLAQLDAFAFQFPGRFRSRFRLELLDTASATQAICKPVDDLAEEIRTKNTSNPGEQIPTTTFSAESANLLVDKLRRVEIGERNQQREVMYPFIEPMHLQLVCSQIWEDVLKSADGSKTEITKDDIDRVTITGALQAYYDEKIHEIAEASAKASNEKDKLGLERLIRDWIEDNLIQGRLRTHLIWTPVTVPDWLDIKALDNAHLVHSEDQGVRKWIELTHDQFVKPIVESNAAWRKSNLHESQRLALLWNEEKDKVPLMNEELVAEAKQWKMEHPLLWDKDIDNNYLIESETANQNEQKIKQEKLKKEQEDQKQHQKTKRFAALMTIAVIALVLLLFLVASLVGLLIKKSIDARNSLEKERDLIRLNECQRLYERDPYLAAMVLREVEKPAQLRHWLSVAGKLLQLSLRSSVGTPGQKINKVYVDVGGNNILTASDYNTTQIWSVDGQLLSTLPHSEPVKSATFSPDGKIVLTSSSDYIANIWSVEGQILKSLVDTAQINSATFSADGSKIVTVSSDKTVQIWSVEGQTLTPILYESTVLSAVSNFDGSQIVTVCSDNTAKVWSSEGILVATLSHKGNVLSAIFDSDACKIVTASADKTAKVWSADGQLLATLEHGATVNSANLSPDGSKIVTASDDNSAKVWSEEGQLLATLPHDGKVLYAIFNNEGSKLVTASSDHKAQIWSVNGILLECLKHSASVRYAMFNRDGTKVITICDDNSINVWLLQMLLCGIIQDDHPVRSAMFSPDKTKIVTAGDDNTAKIWSLDAHLQHTLAHDAPVTSARFNLEGSKIVTAGGDSAKVWSAAGKLLNTITHDRPLISAIFSPDGNRIITTSDSQPAMLWSTEGQLIKKYDDSANSSFNFAVLNYNQTMIATASSCDKKDGPYTVKLWSWNGQLLKSLKHCATICSVMFSRDGNRVVTASFDGTAKIWSVEGEMLKILKHDGIVKSAVFNSDGSKIVTASDDRTAKVWSKDGNELLTLNHSSRVNDASFSSDDRYIITASEDGLARIWLIDPDLIKKEIEKRIKSCLPIDYRETYLGESHKEACSKFAECEKRYGRSATPCE